MTDTRTECAPTLTPAWLAPTRMKATALTRQWTPAYCADWDEATRYLTGDAVENATVTTLRAVLAAGGSFHEPVKVDVETGKVANGMHRLVAALLEDGDVDVADSRDDTDDGQHWTVRYVVDVPPGVTFVPQDECCDDPMGRSWCVLRSFPLGDGWVEGGFSSSGGIGEAVFGPTGLGGGELDPGMLTAEIVRRCAQWGLTCAILSVEPWQAYDGPGSE